MHKFSTRWLAYLCFILLLTNLGVTLILFYTNDIGVEGFDGTYIQPHSRELLLEMLKGQLVSFPFLSLIAGAIVALFIEKDKPYKKRYWKGFFLTLSSIYAALIISGLIRSALTIFS